MPGLGDIRFARATSDGHTDDRANAARKEQGDCRVTPLLAAFGGDYEERGGGEPQHHGGYVPPARGTCFRIPSCEQELAHSTVPRDGERSANPLHDRILAWYLERPRAQDEHEEREKPETETLKRP